MTPYELRREADRREKEAAANAAASARLRAEAAGLRGLLRPLIGLSEGVWTGPAAADFEARVVSHDAALGAQADRICAAATEVERTARRRRAEAAELRQRADAAEAVASAPQGVA